MNVMLITLKSTDLGCNLSNIGSFDAPPWWASTSQGEEHRLESGSQDGFKTHDFLVQNTTHEAVLHVFFLFFPNLHFFANGLPSLKMKPRAFSPKIFAAGGTPPSTKSSWSSWSSMSRWMWSGGLRMDGWLLRLLLVDGWMVSFSFSASGCLSSLQAFLRFQGASEEDFLLALREVQVEGGGGCCGPPFWGAIGCCRELIKKKDGKNRGKNMKK